jgi:hypothetical protein
MIVSFLFTRVISKAVCVVPSSSKAHNGFADVPIVKTPIMYPSYLGEKIITAPDVGQAVAEGVGEGFPPSFVEVVENLMPFTVTSFAAVVVVVIAVPFAAG